MTADQPVVTVLTTRRRAYHDSIRAYRDKLGTDVVLRVVSWNVSDYALDDLVESFYVTAPNLAGAPTAAVPGPPPPVTPPAEPVPAGPVVSAPEPVPTAQEPVPAAAEPLTPSAEAPADTAATVATAAAPAGAVPTGPSYRSPVTRMYWQSRRALVRARRRFDPKRLVKRITAHPLTRAGRKLVSRGGIDKQFARSCLSRPDVMRACQTSDVVVAADAQAVLAAWKIARKVPGPAVLNGIDAAAQHTAARR